ncbi:hypothetical protein [Sporosarcina ureilytica]|uniref:DUF3784 domain-containing protein n=1 Tax=Sporosarcina ureilytica TaxID=298596 RepID=A0A1D8JEM6_9BACL|nr:hypothetical protein [Sporosarcina ureilytica]AOV07149.1 hypothetical protein BI350_06080 [Sporosarcina ureilytica]
MQGGVGIFIICIVFSMVCFFLSYQIWGKGKLSLIIGYHEETFNGDKSKLAKAVGLIMCELGVLVFVLPFALAYIGVLTGPIYALAIVCGMIIALNDVKLSQSK